jgi:DNA-binding LytR/AlgR family response regulator
MKAQILNMKQELRQPASGLIAESWAPILTASDRNLSFDKLAVPMSSGVKMLPLSDILYLEADSNYTYLHQKGAKPILVSKTLKQFETVLIQRMDFIRIHRSYLINLRFLEQYIRGRTGRVEMQGGAMLEIGHTYKPELITRLQNCFGLDRQEDIF